MRRNRRSSIRKERIIMLASSVFVLAALTLTGLYMKGQEIKEKNDGYTLDFTALEDDKAEEIAKNQQTGRDKTGKVIQSMPQEASPEVEDELDYMPLEAGSDQIEIPGLTDGIDKKEELEQTEELMQPEGVAQSEEALQPQEQAQIPEVQAPEEVLSQIPPVQEEPIEEEVPQVVLAKELHFSEADRLLKPVSGDIIIPYSMDKSVYFTTLDQYKYNPATIFGAAEGTAVSACAAGKVVSVFDNTEIGHAVTIELGDGYQVTYGQLTDIQVREDNYVEAGDKLGTVAAPTKYFVSEGANLYFRMDKDGQPVNSELLF